MGSFGIEENKVKNSPQHTKFIAHVRQVVKSPKVKSLVKLEPSHSSPSQTHSILLDFSSPEKSKKKPSVDLDKKNKEMIDVVERSLKEFEAMSVKIQEDLKREAKVAAEKEAALKAQKEADLKKDQLQKQQALKQQSERQELARQAEKEEQAKKQAEKERVEQQKAEQQKQKTEQEKLKTEQGKQQEKTALVGDEGSQDAMRLRTQYMDKIKSIKTVTKPKIMSTPNSNRVFQARMLVTRRVGQLTRVQQQVIDIAKEIHQSIEQSQSDSDLYLTVMDVCAKFILKQVETEIAVKRNMAFPLAVICVFLMNKHPQFIEIFLGRMMKKCPYITPCYLNKNKSESMDEYKKRIGFKRLEDKFESEIQYEERMAGFLSLYCAILQTTTPTNAVQNMEHAWTWLARMSNLKPRKITPLLILTFLEMCGHQFLEKYKSQAKKLIQLIMKDIYHKTQSVP
ncbi:GLE1-like protein-domain-containing protein [Gorgonomyces haynaldii]|nr:GLE1-like protein-domain-containing protein [Gorgonomyces haynaldii]